MSFAATKEQIKAQTKTVTRRMGWANLKPGTLIQPVEKNQGLPKGEKVAAIGCPIRIIDVRREPIRSVTDDEVAKEGFPDKDRAWFLKLFGRINSIDGWDTIVTRIEFEYEVPK